MTHIEDAPGKEYFLQHDVHGWRAISYHPHYIMTDWTRDKNQAISDGDNAITAFYDKNAPIADSRNNECEA